jgi:hypothetical protein
MEIFHSCHICVRIVCLLSSQRYPLARKVGQLISRGKRTWLVRVSRPELAALRASRDAARKFADAERDLSVPTVSAVAVGGYIPYVNTSPLPPEYEAVAANVSIPIFNGHLFSGRREAAEQRALEADQRLRDELQRISRDVRLAWASANNAYQRIDVTAQFLRQATLTLQLAQGRYDLSLASIRRAGAGPAECLPRPRPLSKISAPSTTSQLNTRRSSSRSASSAN